MSLMEAEVEPAQAFNCGSFQCPLKSQHQSMLAHTGRVMAEASWTLARSRHTRWLAHATLAETSIWAAKSGRHWTKCPSPVKALISPDRTELAPQSRSRNLEAEVEPSSTPSAAHTGRVMEASWTLARHTRRNKHMHPHTRAVRPSFGGGGQHCRCW